jgi:2Fe-2S ferredoxin
MPQVSYVQPDGARRDVDVPAGTSVMKAAIHNDIPGIVAECGGSLMCATCHVYVDAQDADRIPAPDAEESEMLEVTAAPRRPTSRLSCQVIVADAVGALTVYVPKEQT